MKKLFKKLLPALIVALVLISALAVTAYATDEWPALVKGKVTLLDMSQSGVDKTNYNDIDGNSAWVQVVTNSSSKTRIFDDSNFYWGFFHRAYYNSTTQTLVIIPSSASATMSGRAGTQTTGEETVSDTANTNPNHFNSSMNKYYVHGFDGWLNTNGASVKTLEFRPYITSAGANSTSAIISQDFGAYVADNLANIETVKLTTNFTFRCGSNDASSYNKIFENKASLKTVQYGDFAQNGTFTTDCPANAVTLMEGNKAAATNYGVSAVIFSGCSSIERVIIKGNTMGYVGLKNNAFKDCTSLKFVYIGTAMSDSYLVGTDAFTGCSGVNVYVNDTEAATALAAVTGITLKAHTAYEADIESYIYGSLLTSKGILVKVADTDTEAGDNVAIRFLFRWDAANTPAAGTPVKVGLVACSAQYYATVAGDTEKAKLAALLADESTYVKKNDVAVYNDGAMSLRGKFLADGTDVANGIYNYAYTLYGIPEANYDSEIYAATYIEWSDGTYYVVSNGYTDSTGADKNTISLYDVTLGLFKQGLINSEKVADKYLWDVIEGQEGSETATNNTTSATTGINVEYFYLPDHIDGGYVLAYRAITKYADDGVTLKGATMPHNVNGGGNTAYNKFGTLYDQTNTIVVDHGITAFGGARVFGPKDSGDDNTSIKTVVYPSGLVNTSAATHMFHNCAGLENVIWCHTDSDGNYVEHMTDVVWNQYCTDKSSLFDLRGIPSVASSYTFTKCLTKNIVLKKGLAAFSSTGKVVWAES